MGSELEVDGEGGVDVNEELEVGLDVEIEMEW